MSAVFVLFTIAAGWAGILVAGAVWGLRRARRARIEIRSAIERLGYEVVSIKNRELRLGPFSLWDTSRSQYVFRVLVRQLGRQRVVWARWGRTWLTRPDVLELKWEDWGTA